MVPNRTGISHPFEDACPRVVYLRDLAMLDGMESLELCAELDSEALESEADSECRKKFFIVQMPKIAYDTDICWIVWRTGTWADNYG